MTSETAAAARAQSGPREDADQDIPELANGFWDQLEIQQACRERHFGHLLKSYRELRNPPLKQAELALLLGLTQGQVSRIERNTAPVIDLRKLSRWAGLLRIPASILWFEFEDTSAKQTASESKSPKIEEPTDNSEGDDVRRRDLMKFAGIGAALLGSSGVDAVALPEQQRYPAIGMESVEIMREWTQTFRRVDNRFGGGHSLAQIAHYLTSDVEPKLNDARCNQVVRKELFAAAAELYQLAGWMSYDTGNAEQGRKCLRRALQLCQQAGNRPFAAELLAGMSHQASFLRNSDDAVDFALAAKETASRTGIHALVAESAVMAAHGLAQQGNTRDCLKELDAAEAAFFRMRDGEAPPWLGYFDDAYLSAKFGHTLKDLGRPKDAEQFARRSLQMTEGYERGRIFNTALLASTLADQGQVDEAVAEAKRAVQMGGTMRSSRVTGYFTDVAVRLGPFREDPSVQQLFKQMSAKRIPLQRT